MIRGSQSAVAVRFLSSKLPAPQTINQKNAVYDKAWDQADYRLARFDVSKKLVNPNIAAHLVAEQPPEAWEAHVAHCDGGHPAIGHPKVYINLDKPGTHACGYCGKRFYNPHVTKSEEMDVPHIQV